jgi:hypothetical protein
MTLLGLFREMSDACRLLAKGREKRVPSRHQVRRPRPSVRPALQILEDRLAPATDTWIAPAGPAANWDVGTNWTLGRSPNAGDTAVFASVQHPGGSGSDTSCFIPAGDNLPTISTLQVNNWKGTLTLNSDLSANNVNIVPRAGAGGSDEIIINANSHLYALQSLNWTGGSVSGAGSFEVSGTDTINGTDATDKPTLGAAMDIGMTFANVYYAGSLSFATTSQPLVVQQNANITVNVSSSLSFLNNSTDGSPVTAISNGDTAVHSIIVYSGTVSRTNVCELFVCTGLDVESGEVDVSNQQGQTTGNPLHFTRSNGNGSGLLVDGGVVSLYGDLTSDQSGIFTGGTASVHSGVKLTLGVNANSTPSIMEGSSRVIVMGTLVPHGGFTIYTGTFGTGGSLASTVNLDAGNQFSLQGGVMG